MFQALSAHTSYYFYIDAPQVRSPNGVTYNLLVLSRCTLVM